jgi:hypothetical protein
VVAACVAPDDDGEAPVPLIASEELRIGSVDDSATALTYVIAAAIDDEGGIYSLHSGESAVRVHNAAGAPLLTIGRSGEGPGEFRRASALGIRGDTLWVLDTSLNRFSFFDRLGGLLRSRDIRIDAGRDPSKRPPVPRGLLADGTIWGEPHASPFAIADGTITENAVVRMGWDAAVMDTLFRRSVANTVWRGDHPSGTSWSIGSQPFADNDLVGISSNRREIVSVQRAATDAASAEFTVTKLTLNGDTIWARAFKYAPRSIPEGVVDSVVDEFGAAVLRGSDSAGGRGRALALASFYRPPALPPVSSLLLGRDGSVWLQRENTGAKESDWWVLDVDGAMYGSVAFPANASLLAAEHGRVWAMVFDSLDVPYITRYAVAR